MLGEVHLAGVALAQNPQNGVSREGRAAGDRHGQILTTARPERHPRAADPSGYPYSVVIRGRRRSGRLAKPQVEALYRTPETRYSRLDFFRANQQHAGTQSSVRAHPTSDTKTATGPRCKHLPMSKASGSRQSVASGRLLLLGSYPR